MELFLITGDFAMFICLLLMWMNKYKEFRIGSFLLGIVCVLIKQSIWFLSILLLGYLADMMLNGSKIFAQRQG